MSFRNLVSIPDVVAASRVVKILDKAKGGYSVQGADGTVLADVRKGPNILIGSYDNRWTLRATKDLRTFSISSIRNRVKAHWGGSPIGRTHLPASG
jgi:hypothetical protein